MSYELAFKFMNISMNEESFRTHCFRDVSLWYDNFVWYAEQVVDDFGRGCVCWGSLDDLPTVVILFDSGPNDIWRGNVATAAAAAILTCLQGLFHVKVISGTGTSSGLQIPTKKD